MDSIIDFDLATKLYPLLPLLTLVAVGLSVLVFDLIIKGFAVGKFILMQFGCVLGLIFLFQQLDIPLNQFTTDHIPAYLAVDSIGVVSGMLVLCGLSFTLMFSFGRARGLGGTSSSDLDLLMVFATVGGLAMVSAGNLILLFLAVELLSVSAYVLTCSARASKQSSEAALKYLVMGAFSSAFLLFGIALIYGAVGSVELVDISRFAKTNPDSSLLLLGLGLLFFGFLFKVGAAPFHFWSPDVYQGAPTVFTIFMAVVVKMAAFGALLRVCLYGFSPLYNQWVGVLWIVAILSMTVGNLMALGQTGLKRLLAYSGVSHAGFVLIGLVAGGRNGTEATMFYMMAYGLMTLASFGVVLVITNGAEDDDFSLLDGLGWSRPTLGACMAIALLSLAGIPPLVGFLAKFYVIMAAFEGGYSGLAVIAMLNSAVSLYYYAKLVARLYLPETERSLAPVISTGGLSGYALAFLSICIVAGGIFSGGLIGLLQQLFV
jgi:NADH-quinone oxidoreductase subunit N